MQSEADRPVPPAATVVGARSLRPPDPWTRTASAIRAAVLAGWVLLMAVTVLVGERESSLADLERAVASGDVREVDISGGLSLPASRGYAHVDVHWRDGLLKRTTTVVEARPRSAARDIGGEDRRPVVTEDLGARLTRLQPGLDVQRVGDDRGGLSSDFLGWHVSGRWSWLFLGAFLGTALLVLASPEPWRATRWAWVWLLWLATPVGLVAYLLLGGPTPLVPAPRDPSRRLTGGWALLIALLLGGLLRG